MTSIKDFRQWQLFTSNTKNLRQFYLFMIISTCLAQETERSCPSWAPGSLPVFVGSVLLIFFSFLCSVLFVFVLCFVYHMFPLSLVCPFLITSSVFSNVYLQNLIARKGLFARFHRVIDPMIVKKHNYKNITQCIWHQLVDLKREILNHYILL